VSFERFIGIGHFKEESSISLVKFRKIMNKKGGIKSFPLQGTKPQFRIFLGNFSEEKMFIFTNNLKRFNTFSSVRTSQVMNI